MARSHNVWFQKISIPPPRREVHQGPPPPPFYPFFHFIKKTVAPLPSGFSTNVIKTTHPLWKGYFFGKKILKNSKHKYSRRVLLLSVTNVSINIRSK